MSIINLSAQPYYVNTREGVRLLPSGEPPEIIHGLNSVEKVLTLVDGAEVELFIDRSVPEVRNLPEPVEGVLLLVNSGVKALLPEREDLIEPLSFEAKFPSFESDSPILILLEVK